MPVYYNENDKFAAKWLKELMKAGEIPEGEIDTRSITEVKADDIKGFTQCHWFAGIGGWSLALQLANWDTDRPVWTGSCPCQPFSTAGKQKGKKDERHLWPIWFNLIRQCKPPVVFGEQVSSSIALGWLDSVYDDLEREGYAVGSALLPACAVEEKTGRERLWFVGNTEYDGSFATAFRNSSEETILDHAKRKNKTFQSSRTSLSRMLASNTFSTKQWLLLPDGKYYQIEPQIQLLDYGVSNRVGKMRGYGNAIVPRVGAEFIKAFMLCQSEL